MKKLIIGLVCALAASLTTAATTTPADASPSVITLHMAEKRHRDAGLINHSARLNWLWKIPLQDGATDWAKFTVWHWHANFNGTRMNCGFWSKYGWTTTTVRLYVWQPRTGRNFSAKGTLKCQEDTTVDMDKGLLHTPRFYFPGTNGVGDQVNYRMTYVDHLIWRDDQSGQFQGHLTTP
jgi:hypothetical protein